MLTDASASSSAAVVGEGSMHDIWQSAKPLLAPHKALDQEIADMELSFEAIDLPPAAIVDVLGNLVDLLGKLCAPVRDTSVKAASDRISGCRELLSLQGATSKAEDAVQAAKASVYTLVQEMQQDMKAFKAGYTAVSKGEGELREEMRSEAMKRERQAVTELYGEDIMSRLASWCGASQASLSRNQVAIRLTQLLFHHQALTVPDPAMSRQMQPSDLPPIFLLAAKHLFRMQNRLQAIAVLATLSTLVPGTSSNADWAHRVWTLLDYETDTPESASEHTKVANISDEILLAIDSKADLDATRRDKIRRQVESMLSFEDPVFKLLRNRLEATIKAGVTGEGNAPCPKGFAVEPLPGEIAQAVASLKSILDWAYISWGISDRGI
jgi:hypothetical protein